METEKKSSQPLMDQDSLTTEITGLGTIELPGESTHDRLPQTRLGQKLEQLIESIGQIVSWVWLLLLVTIMVNVTMRYVLGEGRIELEELQWHLYAIGFLVGLSYVLKKDEHVRVDLFRDHFSLRTRAWVDLLGILLLLLPFILLVLYFSVPFLMYSFSINEASQSPGGLSYRWFIKAFLLIGFLLLLLSVLARLTRLSTFLFAYPQALGQEANHGKTDGGEDKWK